MTLLVGSVFHMTRKIVSEMTYKVSMGTLNPTIPYHTIPVIGGAAHGTWFRLSFYCFLTVGTVHLFVLYLLSCLCISWLLFGWQSIAWKDSSLGQDCCLTVDQMTCITLNSSLILSRLSPLKSLSGTPPKMYFYQLSRNVMRHAGFSFFYIIFIKHKIRLAFESCWQTSVI